MPPSLYQDLTENFGRNLSTILDFHGVKQKELATVMDFTETYISTVCNGKNVPSLKTICDLSDIFGFQVEDMAHKMHFPSFVENMSGKKPVTTISQLKSKIADQIKLRKEILKI